MFTQAIVAIFVIITMLKPSLLFLYVYSSHRCYFCN